MTRFESTNDFREFLLANAGSLPPQQRSIADYLLRNLQEVPFLAVPELAELTRVSEATIVRFAQSIGFSGYRDLKMELLQLPSTPTPPPQPIPDGSAADSHRNVLQSVARLESDNIRATVDLNRAETIEAVVDAIHAADHVYVFGMGVSAPLASMSRYMLTEVGVRCTMLSTDFTSPREQLFSLRKQDLLIAFSFQPYSRQTLDVLQEAHVRAATRVVVTDGLASPAASFATFTLPVQTHNMMLTNGVAAVVMLLNAVATQFALRHRSRALEAFAHMSKVFTVNPDIADSRQKQEP